MRPLLALLVPFVLAHPAAHATDPTPLASVWEYETPRQLPQAVAVDEVGGKHLFVALKGGGLAVLALDRERAPKLVATLGVGEFGKQDVMHITQRGDKIVLALGDLHAVKGARAGIAVVDVKKPSAPKVLGVWTSEEVLNGAAAVVADERHAYLAAMSVGVMVFDISTPSDIRHLSTFQPDVDYPRARPNKLQHPNARGLVISGDTLYVAYDAGGLRVLDVSDRRKPKELGRYVNPGMGKKQQAYNSLALDGELVYAAVDYAGLEILNVKRPGEIRQVGWWNPWKADGPGNVWANSPGHTNQLALDRKGRRVYVSGGDSDLRVVDVSDPKGPTLAAQYGEPKDGRGTWGVTLAADTAYLTYLEPPLSIPFRGTWSGIKAIAVK